jgi:hypothetical protein
MSEKDPKENLPVEKEEEVNLVYTTDDSGCVVGYDMATGKIIHKEETVEEATLDLARRGRIQLDHTGKLPWTFSQMYADLICTKMLEGRTLTQVCEMQGMPPRTTVSRWRSMYPEFEQQIRIAQKMAAEKYHDDVAHSVEEEKELGKDLVPAAKMAFDKRKWLAEKNDPDRYGPRTKVSGDVEQPITVVVDTGIRRDPNKKRRDLS